VLFTLVQQQLVLRFESQNCEWLWLSEIVTVGDSVSERVAAAATRCASLWVN
jgi:hypothetical protein